MDIYSQTLIWVFSLAIILGAVANRTNFCTMGAISDWVNFGDLNRTRSWFLAIAVAILGVAVLEYLGYIDLSLTTDTQTSNPPYRVANLVWLRNLLGGVLFGIGMTLASGCGNKTLVRLGEGNLKSLIVFIAIALSAGLMIFTSFDYFAFLQWMTPLAIDFTEQGIQSQDIASVVAGVSGAESSSLAALITALIIAAAILAWVFRSADFRDNLELIFAGVVIGGLVVAVWYLTAGPQGIELIDEMEFMEQRPYAAGAQSFSFIAPSAHTAQYIYQGFAMPYLSIGIAAATGVVVGSFFYTLIFRSLRLEWFASGNDFMMHVIGGSLMGIGGVLGMGCTIGQGITGVSTLAIGSFITLASIIAGCAATMKYQYYLMMREDD
ncbi:MAG: putative membrane protein YedE/YeeE [Planctomycetota bacterium]